MTNKFYEQIKEYIKYNLSFIIFLSVLIIGFSIDTNYVVYKSGGSINITERINKANDIDNKKGSFNMAYVGMLNGRLPFYLMGKIIPSWEVAPKENVTLGKNETLSDALKRDSLFFKESISSAKYVAYQKSGVEFSVKNKNHYIIYVDEKSTADIKIGSKIISYDDNEYENIEELKAYIQTKEVGDKLEIKYKEKDKIKTASAKVYEEDETKLVGLAAISIYDIESEYEVIVDSKSSESGPSGGLILSLAIYEALTGEDLTKGNTVVGTGTIDINGKVEEIGGVEFKLSGAVKKNADLFIVPKENLEEALKFAKEKKYDILIKGVSTFDEALLVLRSLGEKK